MAVYKTEAVILKRINFGEADRLLTCFSKSFGKINLLAKGVRKITSKKAGSLELLNWCKLSCASGQNLDLVLESEVRRSFLPVKSNLYKTSLAYQVIEVVDKLTIDRQSSTKLFELLIQTFAGLAIQAERIKQKLIIAAFQLQILQILGFYSPTRFLPSEKNSTSMLAKSIFAIPLVELTKMEFSKREVEAVYNWSQNLVEEVAERQIKSSQFVKELDNRHPNLV